MQSNPKRAARQSANNCKCLNSDWRAESPFRALSGSRESNICRKKEVIVLLNNFFPFGYPPAGLKQIDSQNLLLLTGRLGDVFFLTIPFSPGTANYIFHISPVFLPDCSIY
ncbi:hypothetical protein CEXT_301601 [Caerostris extrusa]|uniref:Uncharacterized protein n=1 Tax=Caerostris extrusa TaxID=172846 RepID=A0AAV4SZ82_CAEEX|nr:hypothetical protein CEXT_301601 [Caerostris extrusa]